MRWDKKQLKQIVYVSNKNERGEKIPFVVVPKADHDDQAHWHHEEECQHSDKRDNQQPADAIHSGFSHRAQR